MLGRIKSFNPKHGFGFIDCPDARNRFGRDVFIHRAQIGDLEVGQEITFLVEPNKGGMPQAREIRKLDGSKPGPAPKGDRPEKSEKKERGEGKGGDDGDGEKGGKGRRRRGGGKNKKKPPAPGEPGQVAEGEKEGTEKSEAPEAPAADPEPADSAAKPEAVVAPAGLVQQ